MEAANLLPLSTIVKVAKHALATSSHADGDTANMIINKAAKTSLANATSCFLLYVINAANNSCLSRKRQSITVADIYSGLQDCQWGELVPILETFLSEHNERRKRLRAGLTEGVAVDGDDDESEGDDHQDEPNIEDDEDDVVDDDDEGVSEEGDDRLVGESSRDAGGSDSEGREASEGEPDRGDG